MARSKSILFITVIWLVVLLSGCVDEKNITAVPTTPAITTNVTSTPSAIAPEIAPTSNGLEKSDLNGTIIVEPEESPTPAPSFTAPKEALSTALYVTARMKPMSNWSSGKEIKYELNWLKVYILSLIHISEPTRLGMISYAVFCLKKKKKKNNKKKKKKKKKKEKKKKKTKKKK